MGGWVGGWGGEVGWVGRVNMPKRRALFPLVTEIYSVFSVWEYVVNIFVLQYM